MRTFPFSAYGIGLAIGLLCAAPACSASGQEEEKVVPVNPKPVQKDTIPYLALGDSYTIGESVAPIDRYPEQLAGRLKAAGIPISDPVIVARTGWSTGDLISALDANPPSPPFRIVTLLIGVNNQYRKLGLSGYETQFKELLNRAIQYAGRERVFVFSIPDYAYTPFGQRTSDPSRISNEIDEYNALNRKITESQGVLYFDIPPISRRGLDEPVLVASDGLHPSGEMYRRWVDLALPAITERLKK
mgnify:CR=1 FL=1